MKQTSKKYFYITPKILTISHWLSLVVKLSNYCCIVWDFYTVNQKILTIEIFPKYSKLDSSVIIDIINILMFINIRLDAKYLVVKVFYVFFGSFIIEYTSSNYMYIFIIIKLIFFVIIIWFTLFVVVVVVVVVVFTKTRLSDVF